MIITTTCWMGVTRTPCSSTEGYWLVGHLASLWFSLWNVLVCGCPSLFLNMPWTGVYLTFFLDKCIREALDRIVFLVIERISKHCNVETVRDYCWQARCFFRKVVPWNTQHPWFVSVPFHVSKSLCPDRTLQPAESQFLCTSLCSLHLPLVLKLIGVTLRSFEIIALGGEAI